MLCDAYNTQASTGTCHKIKAPSKVQSGPLKLSTIAMVCTLWTSEILVGGLSPIIGGDDFVVQTSLAVVCSACEVAFSRAEGVCDDSPGVSRLWHTHNQS